MFSSTTIASSMTMPTESVSASIVSMLSVKPAYQTSANVATIDVGMAIAAMIVERRLPRNSRTTKAARNEPTTRRSSTRRDEASRHPLLMAHGSQVLAGRRRGLDVLEPFLHVADHFHRVGARLLAD